MSVGKFSVRQFGGPVRSGFLATLIATTASIQSLKAYFEWNLHNSGCEEHLAERGLERVADSALQEIARGVEDEASKLEDETWDVSVRAEGRSLIYTYHAKSPITDLGAFHRNTASNEKEIRDDYCSDENSLRVQLKATVTQTYYDANGDWLTSFSFKSGRLLIRRMRRFPPPWTVEAIDGFKIVDSHNQSLAYVLRPFG